MPAQLRRAHAERLLHGAESKTNPIPLWHLRGPVCLFAAHPRQPQVGDRQGAQLAAIALGVGTIWLNISFHLVRRQRQAVCY